MLAAAGLTAVAHRKYGELSGGQKQRVQFALAICGNPDLLFLDEPTVGLDVESRRGFWQEVRRLAARGCADPPDDALSRGSRRARRPHRGHERRRDRGRRHAGGRSRGWRPRGAIRCVTALPPAICWRAPASQSVRHDGAAVEMLTHDAEVARADAAGARPVAQRTRDHRRRSRGSVPVVDHDDVRCGARRRCAMTRQATWSAARCYALEAKYEFLKVRADAGVRDPVDHLSGDVLRAVRADASAADGRRDDDDRAPTCWRRTAPSASSAPRSSGLASASRSSAGRAG